MTETRNGIFVSALVAGLARAGVHHACVAPGSRNTPLSLALAAHSGITDWSHHDERSGAFFALGLAKTLRQPVAVVTTSGTAAAELHPALVEADAARVPLVAITADRPTELWDLGAPQTIDQRHLFGAVLRWHHDLDVPDPDDAGPAVTVALAARLAAEAAGPPAGPVHLNVRFRDPLMVVPRFDPLQVPEVAVSTATPSEPAVRRILELVDGRHGVLLVGPQHDPGVADAAVRLATVLGWPVVSDPISGLRAGAHPVDHVVGSDLLAATGFVAAAAPQAVIRVGAPPTSKSLRSWLARAAVPQVVVDSHGWPDPDATATFVLRADPAASLHALAAAAPSSSGDEWRATWIEADRTEWRAAADVIDAIGFPSEPAVATALARSLPDGAALWTASSLPVREIDSWFPVTGRPVAIMGNRGANGIDGFVSTALGAAATGIPVVAHAGDLSALHDATALATAARLELAITILVVNNDGGGIFHFLPQEGHEHFERHFATPHGLSLRAVAEGFGLEAVKATTVDELETAIAETGRGPRLVEVLTDRRTNVAIHRRIIEAAKAAKAAIALPASSGRRGAGEPGWH